MKYFFATLGLLALSMDAAFGAISINGKDAKKMDVTTCYHNLRACYWKYSSVSQLAQEGGLEKLIKQCNLDFADCDKTALETAYDLIVRVATAAGDAAYVAGSAAQELVNKALDKTFIAASKGVDITETVVQDVVDAVKDVVEDAANIAKDAANNVINVGKDVANAAKDFAGRIINFRL